MEGVVDDTVEVNKTVHELQWVLQKIKSYYFYNWDGAIKAFKCNSNKC